MKSLSYSFCFLSSAKFSRFGLAPFRLLLTVSFLAVPVFCASATDAQGADSEGVDAEGANNASSNDISAKEVERYTVTAERAYYNQTLNSIFPQYTYDLSLIHI